MKGQVCIHEYVMNYSDKVSVKMYCILLNNSDKDDNFRIQSVFNKFLNSHNEILVFQLKFFRNTKITL